MTNFDKALHVLGAVSGTLVVAHASGQLVLPQWAVGICGVLAYLPTAVAHSIIGAPRPTVAAPPAPPSA